jgi:hypothetical protein
MSVAITNQANTIKFALSNGDIYHIDKDNISFKKKFGFVHVYGVEGVEQRTTKLRMRYSEVTSPVVASNDLLIEALLGYKVNTGITVGDVRITDGTRVTTLEPNGSIPVTLQDQVTPIIITKMSLLEETTTTTGAVAIDDYVIPVASVTGITAGKYLSIFDPASIRFSNFYVVSVASLNVTVDRPIDFAYPSGSYVDVQDTNMAVNGATTPVVFGVRNNAGAIPPPGLELSVDITRLIFQCITATAVDYDLFGDIAALANGILLRKRDGEYFNIFNVKTTGEIAGIMYDVSVHDVKQGTNGFVSRLTFGGQSKMGAVQRLAINEDLELIVQDNLTGLVKLEITAEGSHVQP